MSDKRFDVVREFRCITEMIPSPIEKDVGQPALVGFRELELGPIDRMGRTKEPVHDVEDGVEVAVV